MIKIILCAVLLMRIKGEFQTDQNVETPTQFTVDTDLLSENPDSMGLQTIPIRVPNIDYLTFGYNIFKGDPLSTKEDPGFSKAQILSLAYDKNLMNGDDSIYLPDTVNVEKLGHCEESSYTKEVTSEESFQKSLQESVEVEASIKISIFEAAFSAGKSFQEISSRTTNSKSIFFLTKAECSRYKAFNLDTPIDSFFRKKVVELPSNGTKTIFKTYFGFLDLFGTHYVDTVTLGSTLTLQTEMTMKGYRELKSQGVNVNFAANAAIGDYFHASAKYGKDVQSEDSKAFQKAVSRKKEITRGSLPSADGLWESWANTAKASLPHPTKIVLKPITGLLVATLFPELSPESLQKRKELFDEIMVDYCNLHIPHCRLPRKGIDEKVFTKFLVGLGESGVKDKNKDFEVVDLSQAFERVSCNPPKKFPFANMFMSGGLSFEDKPIICGGKEYSGDCYIYENGNWKLSHSFKTARTRFAMIKSPFQDGSILFVTGGRGPSDEDLRSTELLTKDGWEKSVDLPIVIFGHCMITLNATSVMVTGGAFNGGFVMKTFIFNSETKLWSEGPVLASHRAFHACGSLRESALSLDKSLIVAGGGVRSDESPNFLISVEILDKFSDAWRSGPDLPTRVGGVPMVEEPTGGVVIMGTDKGIVDMYILRHAQESKWEILKQKLILSRIFHVAIPIRDEDADCW